MAGHNHDGNEGHGGRYLLSYVRRLQKQKQKSQYEGFPEGWERDNCHQWLREIIVLGNERKKEGSVCRPKWTNVQLHHCVALGYLPLNVCVAHVK
jgi:hypothetical protein